MLLCFCRSTRSFSFSRREDPERPVDRRYTTDPALGDGLGGGLVGGLVVEADGGGLVECGLVDELVAVGTVGAVGVESLALREPILALSSSFSC